MPGKPDIAFTKEKVAVFIDGEFWHGYNWKEKKRRIKSNRSYWIPKIERNMARDKENSKVLREMGWQVIRFWEREVKDDIDKCLKVVIEALRRNS